MDDTLKALDASDSPDCSKPEVTKSTLTDEARSRIIERLAEALRAAGYECELDSNEAAPVPRARSSHDFPAGTVVNFRFKKRH